MNPFARFVVVGDGKFLETMKLMTEVAGLSGVVTFTGALYGDDLVSLMRSFTALINTSLRYESETFCIANVEAMALGVPVVSFGIGGVGEYLTHSENGLIVDSFDEAEGVAAAMAEQVVALLYDEGNVNRDEIGKAAAGTVKVKKLEIQDLATKYEELYEELVW